MSMYRLSCIEIGSMDAGGVEAPDLALTRTRLEHALRLSAGLGLKLIRNIRRTLASLPRARAAGTGTGTHRARKRLRPGSEDDVDVTAEQAWLVHSSIGLTFCDALGERLRDPVAAGGGGSGGGDDCGGQSDTLRMLDTLRGPGAHAHTLPRRHQQREAVASFNELVNQLPPNWTLCAVTLTPQNKLAISRVQVRVWG